MSRIAHRRRRRRRGREASRIRSIPARAAEDEAKVRTGTPPSLARNRIARAEVSAAVAAGRDAARLQILDPVVYCPGHGVSPNMPGGGACRRHVDAARSILSRKTAISWRSTLATGQQVCRRHAGRDAAGLEVLDVVGVRPGHGTSVNRPGGVHAGSGTWLGPCEERIRKTAISWRNTLATGQKVVPSPQPAVTSVKIVSIESVEGSTAGLGSTSTSCRRRGGSRSSGAGCSGSRRSWRPSASPGGWSRRR